MEQFSIQNSIKVERAKHNMTQAELAYKVGVSRKTINTIETGRFTPSVITALRIAKAFELAVEDLFYLDPPI